MKVLFASSEVVPFAKTGGLADVSGSLPIALEDLGMDVRVVMPKYASVRTASSEASIGGSVKVYFVENDHYFKRPGLYGEKEGDYIDNLDRFGFFCRETIERIKKEDFKPDIIHCNDWQTALIPVYLKTRYAHDPFFRGVKILYTIHNMAYQGVFPADEYSKIGLRKDLFDVDCFEFYGKLNLMKAGLVYADAISTVSPSYAKEIMTKEFGCGLEGVVSSRRRDLFGILNGLDYGSWDPATDTNIFKNYSARTVDDKYENKRGLQKELGLKLDSKAPVIGIISRLAYQKGFDLLAAIINEVLSMDVQFVLLGTGESKYHAQFEKLAGRYPRNASMNLRFDAKLAQKIYAACDIFLIPSRYEPCGLGQMISFKYGAIPVVRLTGGLKDSVREFDAQTAIGDGFTFPGVSSGELMKAIKRALAVYKKEDVWRSLVTKVMEYDFSWKRSAKDYRALYERILSA
ncbi:MAG: glycogen synthase GlgA [Candidatus Omnitrophota bacterium]